MDGRATSEEIAAFLTALREKGETEEEILGCAEAMRARVVRVQTDRDVVVDTCGTGGDGRGTFNISTVAALVVAAAGVTVAKHGNRAASSKCGSADVLEALGLRIEMSVEKLEACLREVGIAFLYAPALHPAMKVVAPVRRQLGFRTIFNLMGPITNPAFANTQTIGIFDPKYLKPVARVLQKLGTRRAFVYHGAGMDELNPCDENLVVEIDANQIREFTLSASDFGLSRCKPEDLSGGDIAQNAALVREVLEGKSGPRADTVAMNVALALVAAEVALHPRDGVLKARELLRTGEVRRKMDQWVAFSQAV
jgi:anthranilate phosphoribosyltransferase